MKNYILKNKRQLLATLFLLCNFFYFTGKISILAIVVISALIIINVSRKLQKEKIKQNKKIAIICLISILVIVTNIFLHQWNSFQNFKNFSSNPDKNLGPDFKIDIETLNLPFSRGYNKMHSWQVAMSLDPELKRIATFLAHQPLNELSQVEHLFESFLFRWAGVENVTKRQILKRIKTNKEFDVRRIAFLEKITSLYGTNINDASVEKYNQVWKEMTTPLLCRFLSQSIFAGTFPKASYSFKDDQVKINDSLDNIIQNILSHSQGLAYNQDYKYYISYSVKILRCYKSQFADENFDEKVTSLINITIGSEKRLLVK